MARTAVPKQFLDHKKPIDTDEADFAARFYRDSWSWEDYQADRFQMSREILFPLSLPPGHVLMLGTHNGKVFDAWCRHWGYWRCTGYDLINDSGHERIQEIDVRELNAQNGIPVAFAWNDIGSWRRTPEARSTSYDWLKRQIVLGGYLLERSDAIAGWPLSKDLEIAGFEPIQDIWDEAYYLYKRHP